MAVNTVTHSNNCGATVSIQISGRATQGSTGIITVGSELYQRSDVDVM